MAGVINNFWGAETGGLEEAVGTVGTPTVITTLVHSGSYAYESSIGDSIQFAPFESVADAGSKCVFGVWMYTGSAFAWDIIKLTDGTNTDWTLSVDSTNNTYALKDSGGTTRITGTSNALPSNTYHFIEIYVDRVDSGAAEVFVDGVSIGSTTGQDFNAITGTPYIEISGTPGGSGQAARFDDAYFMSGCTSADDRLGGCEVYSYRSNLNSATPDSGDALSTGTWLAIQSIPFSSTVAASYGDTALGAVLTNDVGGSAGTGGPDSDTNITGTVEAAKGVWSAERSGGGATQHYLALGCDKTTEARANRVELITLTTSRENFIAVHNRANFNIGGYQYRDNNTALTGRGICMSADGTKYFRIAPSTTSVTAYNLSTAWDITTASSASETLNGSGTTNTLYGVTFSDDGMECFVSDADGVVWQYSLTTAWNLNTASYSGNSLDASTYENGGFGIFLGDSGTKLFVCGPSGNDINRFDLSTADDLSTASYAHTSSSLFRESRDISFDSTGKYVAIAEYGNGEGIGFWLLRLDTAWTVNSGVTVLGFKPRPETSGGGIHGVAMRPTGEKIYAAEYASNGCLEYEVGFLVPDSDDYLTIGFGLGGAQDFEVYGMLGQVLHVPANDAVLEASSGSFTLAGVDTDFSFNLEASAGSFALTGQAATFTHIAVDYEFEGYRFRNDDGSESTATWKATQDANITEAVGVNVRLRTLIDATGNPDSAQVTLQYRKVGDATWKTVR